MIAKMVLGYETSKLLVMQAAWMKDQGRRNTRETSLAKWHATESAFEAAHLAIQVHGAYGYSAEYGIERYFRNARAPIIYEGTTQIHKLLQAEHALGYRRDERPRRRRVAALLVGAGARAGARALEAAAPGPLVDPVAEPDCDGVVPHVEAGGTEVLVVAKHARVEPALEEMADAAVLVVEAPRVPALE